MEEENFKKLVKYVIDHNLSKNVLNIIANESSECLINKFVESDNNLNVFIEILNQFYIGLKELKQVIIKIHQQEIDRIYLYY